MISLTIGRFSRSIRLNRFPLRQRAKLPIARGECESPAHADLASAPADTFSDRVPTHCTNSQSVTPQTLPMSRFPWSPLLSFPRSIRGMPAGDSSRLRRLNTFLPCRSVQANRSMLRPGHGANPVDVLTLAAKKPTSYHLGGRYWLISAATTR